MNYNLGHWVCNSHMQEALVASTIQCSYFIHVTANLKILKKNINANFIAHPAKLKVGHVHTTILGSLSNGNKMHTFLELSKMKSMQILHI